MHFRYLKFYFIILWLSTWIMPLNWAYKVYPYQRTKHNLRSPSSMYYDNVMPLFTYWRSSSLTVLFHWSCKYILIAEVMNFPVFIYCKPRIIKGPTVFGQFFGRWKMHTQFRRENTYGETWRMHGRIMLLIGWWLDILSGSSEGFVMVFCEHTFMYHTRHGDSCLAEHC